MQQTAMMTFTRDHFICGICSAAMNDIEEYVAHMIHDESCTIVLMPSKAFNDLLLPRFMLTNKKREENETYSLKNEAKQLWKCTLCSFTFNQYSSFVNHCELSHKPELNFAPSNLQTVEPQTIRPKFVKVEDIQHVANDGGPEVNVDYPSYDCNEPIEDKGLLYPIKKWQRDSSAMSPQYFHIEDHYETQSKLDKDDHRVFTIDDNDSEIEVDQQGGDEIIDIESDGVCSEIDKKEIFIYCSNTHTCKLCSQTFKTARTLRQHLTVVHSSRRLFKCNHSDCQQSFKTKGSLLRHSRNHTGERPFNCYRCGRSFRESGTLQRHIQSKISCSFRFSGRNGSVPNSLLDSKTNVKLLKEEELFTFEEDEQCDVEESLVSPIVATTSQSIENFFPGKIVKQERDRDFSQMHSSVAKETTALAHTVSVVANKCKNDPKSLLNIKQEFGNRCAVPSSSSTEARNCKRELVQHCSDEEEDYDDHESMNYDIGMQSIPPDSPSSSSVTSFNPSLIEVPVTFPSTFLGQPNSPEHDDGVTDDYFTDVDSNCQSEARGDSSACNLKHPSPDVKPRLTACDIKPNLKSEVTRNTTEDQSDSSAASRNLVLPNSNGKNNKIAKTKFKCIYRCPHCNRTFNVRSALMVHLYTHTDKMGPHCSECRKSFSSKEGVVRHIVQHLSVRKFLCEVCSTEFCHPSQVQQHMLSHSSAKSVLCDVCGKAFKTVSARNLHARSHSDTKETCEECGKSFSTRSSLLRHARTHTGEKPFICPHCRTAFRDQGTLARHVKHKKPCCFLSKSLRNDADVVSGVPALNANNQADAIEVHEDQNNNNGDHQDAVIQDAVAPLEVRINEQSLNEPVTRDYEGGDDNEEGTIELQYALEDPTPFNSVTGHHFSVVFEELPDLPLPT